MVAAPFKATIKMRGQDGWTNDYACTVSDVNGEFYVWEDGGNDVVLPSTHGILSMVDLVLSNTGTDTSNAEVFINGKTVGRTILNASNQGTNFSRQFTPMSPMLIAAGARLKIKQKT